VPIDAKPGGPWRYSVLVRGQEIELEEGEATVGRSRASTVAIADSSISRVHARLHLRFGRVTIEDLGSSNGTYVNGIRLMALAEVEDGDRLTVGETDLWIKVRDRGAESASTELATRRIDPRRYLCAGCGRAFADEDTQCAGCGASRPRLEPDPAPRPESGPLGPFPPSQKIGAPIETPDATRVARRSDGLLLGRWLRRDR
jgi:pSer/pThr/pTyr-binding forkhead associated (FHA) protein